MFLLVIALVLVLLLFRWDEHAFHQPHNVRFALRYALLRWFLLVVLLWLTVSVLQRRVFIPYFLSSSPPHPGVTNKPVGPLPCATGFD
jgi:multisubunit Na+/H+ antiporter MnhB subunit